MLSMLSGYQTPPCRRGNEINPSPAAVAYSPCLVAQEKLCWHDGPSGPFVSNHIASSFPTPLFTPMILAVI